MYILSEQRDRDEWGADDWERYLAYLESVRDRLPPSAYALATADWHYSFADPRSAHDARLMEVSIGEPAGPPDRFPRGPVSLRIRLFNAEGNGILEFRYPRVARYRIVAADVADGHGDWRYDEIRLSDAGLVLHEIEWWSSRETSRWIIEAPDVEFEFHPIEPASE